MGSEREWIAEATRDFAVTVADTPAALDAARQLRHQAHRVEPGLEPARTRGTSEGDEVSAAQAWHVLLTRRSTGRVVGTTQVAANRAGQDGLSIQKLCSADLLRALPLGGTGEIGPLVIANDALDAGPADGVLLRLGLLRGVVSLSVRMGLTHWCSVMDPMLLRLLRASGIHFRPLGPAIEHRGGLRQPAWAPIGGVLGRVRHERPAVWDYVTERGLLWRDEAVSVVVSAAA